MKMNRIVLIAIGSIFLFGSCKKKKEEAEIEARKTESKTTYANIAYNAYKDSYDKAVDLQTAIYTFVDTPTQANFDACKQAWLDAREPYGQTEVFRFSDGPIDDIDGPEGMINGWPLDESYVDYVSGAPNSGIINNTSITIDATTLESLNEVGGEENISVGYHAIEFLLWGQDNTAPSADLPGQRSYMDYDLNTPANPNPDRRGQYLKVCADLLVQHLAEMRDEWATNGSYRSYFINLDNDLALQKMLSGMGILSKAELAGERMFVALDNSDQEDEHSCFSDNTHRDIILNAKGIQNVYLGSYTTVSGSVISGTSLKDVMEKVDADLNTTMISYLSNAQTYCEAIPNPFDYAIMSEVVGGSGPIMTAILQLQSNGNKLAEVAHALGITISTELPE
ncbi:MAG: hypothetical protein KDC84_02450 [Crocinitomicaceae bacterium]|nr:hypothetical protein [Crocinitomicaceae bacterium]